MTAPGAEHNTISRIVDISVLDAANARFIVEPNEAERTVIAKRLDVPAIRKLRGDFLLTPIRSGVDIVLIIDAVTERTCVASLEPMTETIREEVRIEFDRNYAEEEDHDFADTGILREPLESAEIDLGELLVQHLSLSLDPYPRRDGSESLADKFRDATSVSPFLSLKGLAGGD